MCAALAVRCRHDRKLGSDRVFLQATRDIPAGSEIFVSYGNTYWRIRDMPPTVILAGKAGAVAAAAADNSSTSAQSSDSLDSHASTSSSVASGHSADSDAAVLRRSKRVK